MAGKKVCNMNFVEDEIYMNFGLDIVIKILAVRKNPIEPERLVYQYKTLANIADPKAKGYASHFYEGSAMSKGSFPYMSGYLRYAFIRRVWKYWKYQNA
jgi:hypothetical protein